MELVVLKELCDRLWPDESEARRAGRLFAINCTVQHMHNFGFESCINMFSGRMLFLLAHFYDSPVRYKILRESYEKGVDFRLYVPISEWDKYSAACYVTR